MMVSPPEALEILANVDTGKTAEQLDFKRKGESV